MCVYHYHKLAQNHIDEVKILIKLDKENIPIVTELYNALCNLYEAQSHIAVLKHENEQDWAILEKTGFIKQVSGGNTTAIVDVDGIIDVTDTSNVKFKFQLTARQDVTINGAAYSMTGMTAVRLGAT